MGCIHFLFIFVSECLQEKTSSKVTTFCLYSCDCVLRAQCTWNFEKFCYNKKFNTISRTYFQCKACSTHRPAGYDQHNHTKYLLYKLIRFKLNIQETFFKSPNSWTVCQFLRVGMLRFFFFITILSHSWRKRPD